MPKKTIDKIRVNISLDIELNSILNKKKLNKSALINSLLYKNLALEQNTHKKTQIPNHLSQLTRNTSRTGFEPATFGLRVHCSNQTELTALHNII